MENQHLKINQIKNPGYLINKFILELTKNQFADVLLHKLTIKTYNQLNIPNNQTIKIIKDK